MEESRGESEVGVIPCIAGTMAASVTCIRSIDGTFLFVVPTLPVNYHNGMR